MLPSGGSGVNNLLPGWTAARLTSYPHRRMSRRNHQELAASTIADTRPVLPIVRAYLPSLRSADARVAKVMLEQPHLVISRSAAEVADMANTSGATVVRCAQRLGFKGFHDLRVALASELAAAQDLSHMGNCDEPDDPDAALLRQVTSAGAAMVRDAAALVDIEAFRAAADAVSKARRILFVGVGTSAPLCHDAAFRLTLLGLEAHAPADVQVQHVKAQLLDQGDVCVTVSWTGQTRESLTATRSAARSGATTIAITSFARSALTELVDHTLVAGTRDVSVQLHALTSRLALLALLDSLLAAVASRVAVRAHEVDAAINAALMEHYL
jgi:RpiR family carbohydrate utilization transcriptional regulator